MLAELEGVPIHHPRVYFPIPSRFFPGDYWERTGHAIAAYVHAKRELRDADLMYAQFLCHEGYAGLIAARSLDMPLVAIARGDDVHAWPERWPDRKDKLAAVLAGAEGLLANNHALARDAQRWSQSDRVPEVEVVYNGVDCHRFFPVTSPAARHDIRRRFGLPVGRRLLLSVGWPSPAKGWLDLFEALAALGAAVGDWDIAMATPEYAPALDLVGEASRRGLASRAWALGPVLPELMPDLYRASDAFVLASHNEGLSNAVLEAMASGLPVITTDVGGHSEIVCDGVNGRLVPARDVRLLAVALRQMLTDSDGAAILGAAARQRVVQIGDFRTNAARLVRYFECVMQARRRRATGGGPLRLDGLCRHKGA